MIAPPPVYSFVCSDIYIYIYIYVYLYVCVCVCALRFGWACILLSSRWFWISQVFERECIEPIRVRIHKCLLARSHMYTVACPVYLPALASLFLPSNPLLSPFVLALSCPFCLSLYAFACWCVCMCMCLPRLHPPRVLHTACLSLRFLLGGRRQRQPLRRGRGLDFGRSVDGGRRTPRPAGRRAKDVSAAEHSRHSRRAH